MKLLELIDIAYRRGCGSSLEQAQRTRAFRKLKNYYGDTETAAIQHLGDQLLTAAEACLPRSLKRLADQWSDTSASGQRIMLEQLMRQLTSAEWHELRNSQPPKHERRRQSASSVLPHEHGPWATGPQQPNCLGLATLLMAWARRAGARHVHVHVLRTAYHSVLQLRLALSLRLISAIEQTAELFSHESPWFRSLQYWSKVAMKDLANLDQYDFHAALVIQLADGSWLLVDPYLNTGAELVPAEWPLDQVVEHLDGSDPARIAFVTGADPYQNTTQTWARSLKVLSSLTKLITEMADSYALGEEPVAVGLLLEQLLTSPEARLPELSHLNANDLVVDAMAPAYDRRPVTQSRVNWGVRRFERDPAYCHLVIQRMLGRLYHEWYWAMSNDTKELEHRGAHPAMEFTIPTTGVAVGVLNNLRCWLKPRPVRLGGALLRHSRSQTIWHDTRLEVQSRRQLPPELSRAFAKQEQWLREAQPDELHPRVRRLLTTLPISEGGENK